MKRPRAHLALALTAGLVMGGTAGGTTPDSDPARRATQIVGMDVESVTGESLAQVKDIILDSKGVATHLVLSYGGTLGVGATLLAVPWSAATAMMDGHRIVMSRVRLLAAPTFADSRWPDLAQPGWSAAADRYWQATDTRSRSGAEVDDTHRSRQRPERD
jgi:sporulation protein YlmC with PRC-barrel domain